MAAAAAPPPPAPTKRTLTFVEFCDRVLGLKLTKAQRVMSLVVFDGVEPEDLETEEERKIADEMFGGIKRISPEARDSGLAVFRLGRRSGKTMIVCAARAIYRLCTADVSGCTHQVPAAIIVAPSTETAKIAMNVARSLIEVPKIRSMVVGSSSKGFELRRPQDGRHVEFIIRARARGGVSLRGYDLVEGFMDEAEFVPSGGANAVVNDREIIDGGTPALTPGARINIVSTPWPAPSECARLFEENFGHPSTAIAVCATTPVMRDHDPNIMAKIERDMRRDPNAAQREYFCVLVDGAAGAFFEGTTLTAAIARVPYTPAKSKASAGIDPAFVNDSCGLVVVERMGKRLVVTGIALETPEPQRPLIPSAVIHRFADLSRALGANMFATDVHRVATVRTNAAHEGFQTYVGPHFNDAAVYLRDVVREGKLEIPDTELGQLLVKQMRTVMFKPRSGGGITVILPRVAGAGHADLVPALAQAVYFDRRHGPLLETKVGRPVPR